MRIIIAPYDPHWKDQFLREKEALASLLKELTPVIEHMGSTAVPGLSAKPVIDILVGLSSEEHLNRVPPLLLEGESSRCLYIQKFESSMPGRRFFIQLKDKKLMGSYKQITTFDDPLPVVPPGEWECHFHVVVKGSLFRKRHLAFRDWLRTHRADREAYDRLKRELSLRDWPSGDAYAQAKSEFIRGIEKNFRY